MVTRTHAATGSSPRRASRHVARRLALRVRSGRRRLGLVDVLRARPIERQTTPRRDSVGQVQQHRVDDRRKRLLLRAISGAAGWHHGPEMTGSSRVGFSCLGDFVLMHSRPREEAPTCLRPLIPNPSPLGAGRRGPDPVPPSPGSDGPGTHEVGGGLGGEGKG